MATNPIRRIRHHDLSMTSVSDYYALLNELAALPPSHNVPYLTLSLDWRTLGSDPNRRLGQVQFERDAEAAIQRYWPRGEAFDSVSADVARIRTYLSDELDPAAQGVYIVACANEDIFAAVPLTLPLQTRLDLGPIPALSPLARLIEDHVPYAVLTVSQHEATLSMVLLAELEPALEMVSSDYPRRQQTGGLRQSRLAARVDERINAFARGIAEETQRVMDEGEARMLVVAGNEIMTSALDAEFHPTVKEKIAATIRIDPTASADDIISSTWPLALAWEREQEQGDIETLRAQALSERLGTYGTDAVLRALAIGQAERLIINADYAASGWADYNLPLYGTGDIPSEHPAGGDVADIDATDLRQEMIRLALLSGAGIQIVHTTPQRAPDDDTTSADARSLPAQQLDELGGVGALLRYQVVPD